MDFKSLLKFLSALQTNNNKEWFDANKKTYDKLRKQWLEFVAEVIINVGAFDKDIVSLEAKNCIFRINRDIRFSADKSPYKNNFGMSLSKEGKKAEFCGYYLHVQPNGCFLAGGAYAPLPDKLAAIRQEIDYHGKEFKEIISHKAFKKTFNKLTGETLKRAPKGYEEDNPMIEYIKHKSFLAEYKLTDEELTDKDFSKKMLEVFKTMYPLNEFLNKAISG
jgi:uncharacterized protein (TIGR02453 family)